MGVAITKLIPKKEINIADLKGKVLAVDGYNMLYQFLTTIRGPDGQPLTDSQGNVTSHLTGLFGRITNLMAQGVKFVFCFDGQMPELKKKEIQRRREIKEQAAKDYEAAKQAEDTEGMKKYAARTTRLKPEMVDQARTLLDALGIPWINAPSEGEAQAAALVKQGHAYAVVSQDADALLYEAPRIVRNLAVSGKRKLPGRMAYVQVEPELITHKDVLEELDVTLEQLRTLAVLIGTDYNIGGIKGIGPVKGLKLVKEHSQEAVFKEINWQEHWDIPWQEILNVFESMPVGEPESLDFKGVDEDAVVDLLVKKHEFSPERIKNSLKKIAENTQKGLSEFF
ncbi:MAG: flap endonuclease-1 [Candidatus Woesearchaeota archaeon]|nr:flap endonuclease-1 [Candidatus Woesearchaeota archaeon]